MQSQPIGKAMEEYAGVLQRINTDKPRVIYLSGKTSTGKTTLANYIKSIVDCGVIELDDIVRGMTMFDEAERFVEIYRKRDQPELIASFVAQAKAQINAMMAKHSIVLFEGAIANDKTLAEIVAGQADFLFVYLLPVSLDRYRSRITSRFLASTPEHTSGLPKSFWEHLNKAELEQFYKTRSLTPGIEQSIDTFTAKSIDGAKLRLDLFAASFSNILVVEV